MTPLLLIAIMAGDPSPEPEPPFALDFKTSATKTEQRSEKGAPVLILTGNVGQGEGKLALTKGAGPKRIVLRFAGLKRLELLKLGAGGLSGHITLGTTRHFDAGGRQVEKPDALTLTARAVKDAVEVEVVLKDTMKEVYFAWVEGPSK